MLQQSLPTFGDTLLGKVLGVFRRRAFLARQDVRFGSPQREALRGADSRVAVNASRRFPIPVRVPPSSSVRMRSARRELVRLLDGWPGGRRVQPSLALIERALDRHRGAGLDQVSPCVLAHAAVSLDFLDPLTMGPGLVELRRHIGLLLRRHHGDDAGCPQESPDRASDDQRSFEDSLTEFVELDALLGECDS